MSSSKNAPFALCAAALTLFAAGCEKPAQKAPPPPTVTVSQPVQREIVEWDDYTGRTEAVDSVEVRARVSGYLESIHFKDGALVKAGDLLFVIDPRPYQADLDRAEAELEVARTLLQQATSEAERVERVGANGVVAAEQIEQRRNHRLTAAAAVHSAEAAVNSAKLNVEYTQIKAPISGRIGRHILTTGNVVNSGPFNGTLLTTIVSVDPLHCYLDADEHAVLKYIQFARTGQRASGRDEPIPAQLAFGDEVGYPHEGVVDFLDNRIDPTTGTLRARVVLANPDGRLIPGLFARVRIPGGAKYMATLISDEAIGTDQAQRFVYVVDDQSIVRYRRIVTGSTHEGLRIVREGLKPGDWVVVNGLMRVRVDTPVQVVRQPSVTRESAAPSAGDADAGGAAHPSK